MMAEEFLFFKKENPSADGEVCMSMVVFMYQNKNYIFLPAF